MKKMYVAINSLFGLNDHTEGSITERFGILKEVDSFYFTTSSSPALMRDFKADT